MVQLPIMPSGLNIRGKRVLLRLDWNIPLNTHPDEGDLMKIERSAVTIESLTERGAIVIVMTHLGRPASWDKKYSTARLLPYAETYLGQPVIFCGEDISQPDDFVAVEHSLSAAKPGDVYLLENVRFHEGEEKNDIKLAKIYASLGDIFMNDAFASCHRAHVSVAGIARHLPCYAGPELVREVEAADRLIHKPKKPFVAIVGGSKLSTKMQVIESLLKVADQVCIGGAMANPFFAARKLEVGTSLLETESIKLAKPLLKNPKIKLPVDVLVARRLNDEAHPHAVPINGVPKNECIGDIGPETMRAWSGLIKEAKTILWNGPVGVSEIPAFSHGSLVLGKAIAARSAGPAYGVVGGGDTVPVALATGMSEWFDHVSMGGGALLEYIANKGRLPGVQVLVKSYKSKVKSGKQVSRKIVNKKIEKKTVKKALKKKSKK